MRSHLPIALSAAALVVALLAAAPFGLGASRTVRSAGARPAAVRGVEYVQTSSALSSETYRTITAKCPRGKVAIGGGAVPISSVAGFPVYLRYSFPAQGSWQAQAQESMPFPGKWRLNVIAVCAFVS